MKEEKKDKEGKKDEVKKLRKFKISMVSDRVVTEQEFKLWKRMNNIEFKKKDLDKAKIQLRNALSFKYVRNEMNAHVLERNLKRIKEGNFKGMSLVDIKIELREELN